MSRKAILTIVVLAVSLIWVSGCDEEHLNPTRPILTLDAGEAGQGSTECNVSSCTIDFGLVYLGNSEVVTLMVKNDGDADLAVIDMMMVPGQGGITPFSIQLISRTSLTPGEFLPVDLVYTPTEVGQDEGTFILQTDDQLYPQVNVTLKGRSEIAPAPQLEVCVRTDASDPQNEDLTCVPPQQVDFGQVALVPIGEPVATPIILRNRGAETLRINAVDTSHDTSMEFTLEPESMIVDIPAMQPGQDPSEREVLVWYTPVDGGTDDGFVEISSNDPDNRMSKVRLRGAGIAPRVCTDPLQLDFGRVAVDHTARRSFTVTNCGLLTLTVGTIMFGDKSSPEFEFEALPLTPFDLAPGEHVGISVLYTPADTGFDGGRVYMQSNDPSAETGFVLLQGEGTNDPICDIEVVPERLNFGMVDIGDVVNKTAGIRNTGTAECSVADITGPTGAGAASFVFSSRPITPFVLGPGDQKSIALRYSPTDAGPHRAVVDIVANDFEEEVISVDLYGNDPNVPECDVEVIPTHVAFGTVAQWRTATYPVEIRNRGGEPCVLSSLSWNPQSDTSFTLAQAPSLPAMIPAHGSTNITVAFTPLRQGIHNGEMTVITDDPDTTAVTVTMAGTAEELNLMVIPDNVEFGAVTLGCDSPERNITVYNIGMHGVMINDVYLDDTRTDLSKFQITALTFDNNPATTPFNLPSARSFNILVRYTPQTVVRDTGVLVIESTAALGAYLEVPLGGEGTEETSQTDVFNQLTNPMVDVLWVVDNSGSMIPQQQALAQNFSTFISWAVTLQTDFHIGVISTEINEPEIPADYFNIYPGVLVQYPGFPKIITNTTPNLAQAFAKNVNVGTCCSDEQESGLHAAMMALSEPLVSAAAANAGFLREDAKLVLIMVSDEQDQSPGPPDFYVDFFKNIKGFRNDQLMDVSVVVGDVPNGCSYGGIYAESSPRYKYVQEATGGIFRSHCSSNWGSTLSDLGLDTFAARTQFPLTRPAQVGTIEVTVDAHDGNGPQPVPEDTTGSGDGWEYDENSNSIVFGDNAVPPRGATITISYETTCL